MNVMYPLAIVNTTSITSLVKIKLYHHPISVYHTKIETNEGVAKLGGNARNAATENPITQLVSDIPGVRSEKNQMTIIEEAKTK